MILFSPTMQFLEEVLMIIQTFTNSRLGCWKYSCKPNHNETQLCHEKQR